MISVRCLRSEGNVIGSFGGRFGWLYDVVVVVVVVAQSYGNIVVAAVLVVSDTKYK